MNKASYEILVAILKIILPTALTAWLLGISFVHYMLFALTVSNIFLLLIVVANKNQSDGQVTKIYNSRGKVIGTKYTEQIESGYWVCIITDDEWNLKAEHIRTFENNKKHKNDRDALEHEYNKDVVWGEKYYKKSDGLRFAEKMKRRKAVRNL